MPVFLTITKDTEENNTLCFNGKKNTAARTKLK